MNKELGIASEQYGLIAGIFFFGYFIFEIPSNLLLHRIGARVWIARILISWGIVAMLGGKALDSLDTGASQGSTTTPRIVVSSKVLRRL